MIKDNPNNLNCIFCQIVNKQIKAWIIYENKETITILDAFPIEKGHSLIITKRCCPNILQLDEKELFAINQAAQKVTAILAKKIKPKGFNLINNFNPIAGQVVNHYHLHIIPKYQKDYGFGWTKKIRKEKNDVESTWKEIKK